MTWYDQQSLSHLFFIYDDITFRNGALGDTQTETKRAENRKLLNKSIQKSNSFGKNVFRLTYKVCLHFIAQGTHWNESYDAMDVGCTHEAQSLGRSKSADFLEATK